MQFTRSVSYALQGLKFCINSEKNFRIQICIALITFLSGIILRINTTEWLVVLTCIAFVLSLEMINTSIEKLCAVVNPAIHPVIKKVKDIAAGAVLLTSAISLIIGLIIFLPKIIFIIKKN